MNLGKVAEPSRAEVRTMMGWDALQYNKIMRETILVTMTGLGCEIHTLHLITFYFRY